MNDDLEKATPPPVDPERIHKFLIGPTGRCSVCERKASHLIHKLPRPRPQYMEGEVVGRYWVDEKGCFRRTEPYTGEEGKRKKKNGKGGKR